MLKPLVGITSNRSIDDGVHREIIRRKYIDALVNYCDVDVVILPTLNHQTENPAIVDRLDGLVLTGDESNFDPTMCEVSTEYAIFQWQRERQDQHRDALSLLVIRQALNIGLPIFGICRGLQEMNVALGGSLHDSLKNQSSFLEHKEDLELPRDDQYEPTHMIAVQPGGWIEQICFDTSIAMQKLTVNSLHTQGINRLSPDLRIEAVTTDGLVEAVSVEDSSVFQLAVQWHPEWHVSKDIFSQTLFQKFGISCKTFLDCRN